MTIVNHATAVPISLKDLKKAFKRLAHSTHPGLGSNNIRTVWADENNPTDAELRLIGHSLVVQVTAPTPAEGYRAVAGSLSLINDSWTQTWSTELAPVDVPERVEGFKIKYRLGELGDLNTANSRVNQMTDLLQDAWDGPFIHIGSALTANLKTELGMSDAERDALFVSSDALST